MKRLTIKSLMEVILTSGRKIRSLTFCLAPMIILMTECVRDKPPTRPFAPTNEGRDVVAFRIDKEEYVDWDRYHDFVSTPQFYTLISEVDGKYEFHSDCNSIYFYMKNIEPFKVGVQYSISENPGLFPLVRIKYITAQSKYEAVSGYIKFRHISEKVISGHFECQMNKASENKWTDDPEQVVLTDGTFDLKRHQ